jgi:hypothetical protein
LTEQPRAIVACLPRWWSRRTRWWARRAAAGWRRGRTPLAGKIHEVFLTCLQCCGVGAGGAFCIRGERRSGGPAAAWYRLGPVDRCTHRMGSPAPHARPCVLNQTPTSLPSLHGFGRLLVQICRDASATFALRRPPVTNAKPVSVDSRTRLCPWRQNLPGKGLREPETGRHFAPAIRRNPQQRPETPLSSAPKSRNTGGFSRDRRKSYLYRTAWWAREDSNLQPSGYAPLTLNVLLSFAQFEREVTSERIRDITGRSASQDLASPCRSGADEPRSRDHQ